MTTFKFKNFEPRSAFLVAAGEWMENLMDQLPSESSCEFTVSRNNKDFIFNVLIHSAVGVFESETILRIDVADAGRRDWQTMAFNDLGERLQPQIEDWLETRKLAA